MRMPAKSSKLSSRNLRQLSDKPIGIQNHSFRPAAKPRWTSALGCSWNLGVSDLKLALSPTPRSLHNLLTSNQLDFRVAGVLNMPKRCEDFFVAISFPDADDTVPKDSEVRRCTSQTGAQGRTSSANSVRTSLLIMRINLSMTRELRRRRLLLVGSFRRPISFQFGRQLGSDCRAENFLLRLGGHFT
jgi:hypothetical protein